MTKIILFFSEVRSELQKVVWPSRQDTLRYTIAVIVFSLVMAALIGAADLGLVRLLERALNR